MAGTKVRGPAAALGLTSSLHADPSFPGTEIWIALKAAVESDIDTARVIVDSAGIIVPGRDLSTCWDARGALYSLPKYVLSAPTNLQKDD